jgi:hypothetical protein
MMQGGRLVARKRESRTFSAPTGAQS